MSNLVIIFEDQLSQSISSLDGFDKKNDFVFISEHSHDYPEVKHHKKKMVFKLSSMRHFRKELEKKGIKVFYEEIKEEDKENKYFKQLARLLRDDKIQSVIMTKHSNHAFSKKIAYFLSGIKKEIILRSDNRFFCGTEEFKEWASDRSSLRMEFFYRSMRIKHNILMNEGKPEGGAWNYDKDNRKKPNQEMKIPKKSIFKKDGITKEVMDLVQSKFKKNFGSMNPFDLAVNRSQAKIALKKFITERLCFFGDYQDAMIEGEPWMYHSHISYYLNSGLLLPEECIRMAEEAYYSKKASINSAEGFIRQILGWREFVRGIYWLKMPGYEKMNHFKAKRKLPEFYWTGETKMNCMRNCIQETKDNAYAHHIQRLMVLGNFALLAGIKPSDVNYWYLVVYADAYQWVELPNVSGMTLFADGGILSTKPYAASGGYIKKMSNYCSSCFYNVEKKTGDNACPFNYLFWNFISTHYLKIKKNNRMSMMCNMYEKMNEDKKKSIKESAKKFLKGME